MKFTEKETRVLRIAIDQYIEGLKEMIYSCEYNPNFISGIEQDKKDLTTAKRVLKKLRSQNERRI